MVDIGGIRTNGMTTMAGTTREVDMEVDMAVDMEVEEEEEVVEVDMVDMEVEVEEEEEVVEEEEVEVEEEEVEVEEEVEMEVEVEVEVEVDQVETIGGPGGWTMIRNQLNGIPMGMARVKAGGKIFGAHMIGMTTGTISGTTGASGDHMG